MKTQNHVLGLLLLCSVTQSAYAYVRFSESIASGIQLGTEWNHYLTTPLVSAWSTQQYNISDSAFLPAEPEYPSDWPAVFVSAGISSNLDGHHYSNSPRHTSSGASIDNAFIDLGAAPTDGTFTLKANVNSSVFLNGDYGSLTRKGGANIGYLELRFDPADVNMSDEVFTLAYGTDIGINTDLASLMTGYTGLLNRLSTSGIFIVLNEQYGVCDGVVIDGEDICELGVNGLHIYRPGASEVRLGASYAEQTAVSGVPEPETYAMMLAGLGLVGWAARRRKS